MAEILIKISSSLICNGSSTTLDQQNHHGNGWLSFISSTRVSVKPLLSSSSFSSSRNFNGRGINTSIPNLGFRSNTRKATAAASSVQMRIGIGNTQKWWEQGLKPNMKEVQGPGDLVESLLNAGDKLVVVDFFSPGCGGCKALHPKICQMAEMNPDVQFLQVNYEEHKSMCYALNVHVLPFFRFYRGAHGRLCSFSCTNATIKKFKDALAKHCPDRCSLGPTKGLDERELVALAALKDPSFSYKPKPEEPPVNTEQEVLTAPASSVSQLYSSALLPLPSKTTETTKNTMDETLVASGR